MTHDDLVRVAVRWLKKPAGSWSSWYKGGCGVAVPELVTYNGEIPDAIGWIASGYSYAIECKTSRADFRADRNKPRGRIEDHKFVGAECLYMCPDGVIPVNELPDGWGLLYVGARNRVTMVRTPTYNTRRDLVGEMSLMYSLLRRVEIRGHLRECLSPKWGGLGIPTGPASTGPGDPNG